MQIGTRLPNAGPKVNSVENVVTVARWAEQLGYHSVWASDHVVLPEKVHSYYPYRSHRNWPYPATTNYLDPLLALTWAASVAPNLLLGTSILILPLRNPILLAKQLSTLDHLSGGRVILGAGVGWMEEEFNIVGASFSNRGKRVDEMVKLMRLLWIGTTVNFQGEFWQVVDCKMHPTPLKGVIPIIWGGHSDAALRRVALVGDGWHPTQITIEQLRERIQKLQQFCNQYGRDFESIRIIVRPGDAYSVNADTLDQLEALGVNHLVIDTPLAEEDPGLKRVREQMEQVAEVCQLQPRTVNG